MKSDTITFTSTFSSGLMNWIDERAKKEKTTKRSILEKAVNYYKHAMKTREFEKGFARVAEDPEMQDMADWGLGDYLEQLKKLEE